MDKFALSAIPEAQVLEPIYIACGNGAYALFPQVKTEDFISGIQWVVNNCLDERPFISYAVLDIITEIGLVKTFTNIDIQESLEDFTETYDLLNAAGIIEQIKLKANKETIIKFKDNALKTMLSIITYKNSARGIVDALAGNAENNVEAMQENLAFFQDEGNLQQVRALLESAQKLGYNPD